MLMDGGDPDTIAKALGVIQDSSSENISRVAEKLIQDNPKVVLEIQSGKQEALKFLIGLGMKLTSGSANPELLRAELEKQIFSHG
jgi:aspartyl-tRNA(Asn)/glutamyl-tRNA(Gln) amidotransferase subunit B